MPDENNEKIVTNQDEDSMFNAQATQKKLSEMADAFMLPQWMLRNPDGSKRQCLTCKGDLNPSCVRAVTLCLNAQHIGDIQLEILCQSCYNCYFLHIRKACSKITDFCASLLGDTPKTDLVPMQSIGTDDNNLADAIVTDISLCPYNPGTSNPNTLGSSKIQCSTVVCSDDPKPVEDVPCQS